MKERESVKEQALATELDSAKDQAKDQVLAPELDLVLVSEMVQSRANKADGSEIQFPRQ